MYLLLCLRWWMKQKSRPRRCCLADLEPALTLQSAWINDSLAETDLSKIRYAFYLHCARQGIGSQQPNGIGLNVLALFRPAFARQIAEVILLPNFWCLRLDASVGISKLCDTTASPNMILLVRSLLLAVALSQYAWSATTESSYNGSETTTSKGFNLSSTQFITRQPSLSAGMCMWNDTIIINNRYTCSLPLHWLIMRLDSKWYTQLHFLEPGVKVNGDHYWNTVLLNMLLLDIRSVFEDYYVLQ